MDVEVVRFARGAIRSCAGVGGVTSSATEDVAAEADAVPHDRSYAEIAAYPEFIEIEILTDLRVVEFVLFLLRNRARNDRDVGNLFSLRQFKLGLCRGRHE